MVTATIRFWSYLILLIPSIICTLFVLYHLLFDRTLRHGLNNHVIIVLLIIGFIYEVTVYPWMFYYYKYDDVWERSPIFCTIWAFIDWGLYITQTILFAWATIERHILIFHDRWVSSKKKRFFVHYLPLMLLLLYCLLFYIVIDFFPLCENFYFTYDMVCVYFCSFNIYELYMWETIVHQLLPVLCIVLFSVFLLLRILWHKYRIHQSIQWRKHRKMTIQVLSISLLYLIFSFPFALVTILYLLGLSYSVYGYFIPYANFFSYFIILLLPFVCALTLPELRTKLIKILPLRRQGRRVAAETSAMRTLANNHGRNQ